MRPGAHVEAGHQQSAAQSLEVRSKEKTCNGAMMTTRSSCPSLKRSFRASTARRAFNSSCECERASSMPESRRRARALSDSSVQTGA
eukprot:3051119-Pleurochrysis_carterae.AAC.1